MLSMVNMGLNTIHYGVRKHEHKFKLSYSVYILLNTSVRKKMNKKRGIKHVILCSLLTYTYGMPLMFQFK
jgi:hypothetical protein